MKFKPLLALPCLVLFPFASFSQSIGVDSKGKSIFTHYSKADARFEISTDEPLSLSYIFGAKKTPFTRKTAPKVAAISPSLTPKEKDRYDFETTIDKFTGTLVQLSMLNSDDQLSLTNLFDINPGVGFKIGRQTSIGVFDKLDNIPDKYWGASTWGLNAVFNMDNIQLYNATTSIEGKKLPLSYGIEGNYSLFFKNKNDRKTRNVLAVNGRLLLRTWNDDNLLYYQKLSNTTVLTDAVAMEDFEGRYGNLKTDVTKFRLAVSAPFYYGHLNPIPYFVLNTQSGQSPIYFMGVFTNVLTKSLTKEKFKIPTSLGIGIDTKLFHGKLGSPNLFIKGSISFGEFK